MILVLAALLLAAPAAGGADAAKDRSCGEVFTYGGNKILKVKNMKCGAATEVAHDYERKALAGDRPDPGDTERVRRFECTWVQSYEAGELAYECAHQRQEGKGFKAFHPR